MFDLNPMAVLKQRKLKTLPPHFSKFKLSDVEFFTEDFEDWIESKLRGRYSIVRSPNIDQDGGCKSATFVAFEEEKELTYFMLACPHLRRN